MNTDRDLKDLIHALLDIETEKEMFKFLLGILTEQELDELPRRLKIVKMLKKGMPQHKIAKELGVGVATITRGSKELQRGRFENV